MLGLIRDLSSTCNSSKLSRVQRERCVDLMRQLRGYGFTNPELHVLARGRISEATIKRRTRGVPVNDTSEHDKAIAMLGEFAAEGNTFEDLDDYKMAKETLNGKATFSGIRKLAIDLFKIQADITDVLNLSGDIAVRNLTVPAIQKNIAMNDELSRMGLTPLLQNKILETAKIYDEPNKVLDAIEKLGDIQEINNYQKRLNDVVLELETREIESKKRMDDYNAEALHQKKYIDIVHLLVTEYNYDYYSLKALHELAYKYGDPQNFMGAMNVYADLEQLKSEVSVEGEKLKTLSDQVTSKEERQTELTILIEAADAKIREIKDNYADSLRLQMVIDLLTNAQRLQTTPKELAKLIHAILVGVRENNKAYPGGIKFDTLVRSNIESTIVNFETFLR